MYIPKEVKVKIRYEQRWDHVAQKYIITNESDPGPHLGYATYVDEKGKLRKETSWNGWGNKHLGDFANVPKRGFKLEKAISRSRDWFGSGRTMFRMIHPDNFIFEISANNLNEIILSCNLNKGEIDDECVLAWDGLNLALIPCSTDEYLEHSKTTEKIENGALKPSDLIVGNAYQDRNARYIGHYIGKFYIIDPEIKNVGYDDKVIDSKDYYMRKDDKIKSHLAVLKIKQTHIFKQSNSSHTHNIANPKVYACDKKPITYEKDAIPKRESYQEQVITCELAKSNPAEIIKWFTENKVMNKRYFNYDKLIKYTVKVM